VHAAFFQVTGSTVTYQVIQPSGKVVQSLNLGRDDLYVVTDVERLKYELEVGRCTLRCVLFLLASNET